MPHSTGINTMTKETMLLQYRFQLLSYSCMLMTSCSAALPERARLPVCYNSTLIPFWMASSSLVDKWKPVLCMHTSRQCCPTSISLVVDYIPISISYSVRVQISCNLPWALYINSVYYMAYSQVGLVPRVFILLAQVYERSCRFYLLKIIVLHQICSWVDSMLHKTRALCKAHPPIQSASESRND